MRRSYSVALAAAMTATVGLAIAAGTGTITNRSTGDPGSAKAPTGLNSGMVIAVDPETGELGMPAAGQLGQELSMTEAQAYARRIAAELVTLNHPDGSSTLIHDDRLADYAVMRIAPDGTRQFLCVLGEHAATGALCPNQPISPAQEER